VSLVAAVSSAGMDLRCGIRGPFLVLHGKDYYTAPVYPIALAGGAVAIEKMTRPVIWMRILFVVLLLAVTGASLPLNLPMLSPAHLVRCIAKFPLKPQTSERAHAQVALPHHFAWQLDGPRGGK